MAALFFLSFAYLAVGQASVARNGAQTAADAAALAAAREERDLLGNQFLAALLAGDQAALRQLLTYAAGEAGCGGAPGAAAADYAADNQAELTDCAPVFGPPGFRVAVRTLGTVGPSVVPGTEDIKAVAHATAVLEPRCTLGGLSLPVVDFDCDNGPLDIDPTDAGFILDLSDFYTVHLSD
ncbi:pilus assembly protein TadG-related protein [Streptomyces sp. ITFR-21]|nr:pilus assembly protein TadG-related protein [Streptomyces sp. ITFR-21]WNI19756.1 pilus assembly protein TadG-related protein [Streptomyces sp. ITFR-21]